MFSHNALSASNIWNEGDFRRWILNKHNWNIYVQIRGTSYNIPLNLPSLFSISLEQNTWSLYDLYWEVTKIRYNQRGYRKFYGRNAFYSGLTLFFLLRRIFYVFLSLHLTVIGACIHCVWVIWAWGIISYSNIIGGLTKNSFLLFYWMRWLLWEDLLLGLTFLIVRSGQFISLSDFFIVEDYLSEDSKWKLFLRLEMTKLARKETRLEPDSFRSSPLLLAEMLMIGTGRKLELFLI